MIRDLDHLRLRDLLRERLRDLPRFLPAPFLPFERERCFPPVVPGMISLTTRYTSDDRKNK